MLLHTSLLSVEIHVFSSYAPTASITTVYLYELGQLTVLYLLYLDTAIILLCRSFVNSGRSGSIGMKTEKINSRVEADESFFCHIMNLGANSKKIPHNVVMVLPRPNGRVLVMTKDFYHKGTYRLPSGGMHKGETPEEAFYREAAEETGLPVTIAAKLAEIETQVVHAQRSTHFTMHVFLANETSEAPQVEDLEEEISEFKEVTIDELPQIAEQLRSLPGRWRGWGEFWATPHDVVYRKLKKEENQ